MKDTTANILLAALLLLIVFVFPFFEGCREGYTQRAAEIHSKNVRKLCFPVDAEDIVELGNGWWQFVLYEERHIVYFENSGTGLVKSIAVEE